MGHASFKIHGHDMVKTYHPTVPPRPEISSDNYKELLQATTRFASQYVTNVPSGARTGGGEVANQVGGAVPVQLFKCKFHAKDKQGNDRLVHHDPKDCRLNPNSKNYKGAADGKGDSAGSSGKNVRFSGARGSSPAPQAARSESPSPRAGGKASKLTCFGCGEVGHIRTQCPKAGGKNEAANSCFEGMDLALSCRGFIDDDDDDRRSFEFDADSVFEAGFATSLLRLKGDRRIPKCFFSDAGDSTIEAVWDGTTGPASPLDLLFSGEDQPSASPEDVPVVQDSSIFAPPSRADILAQPLAGGDQPQDDSNIDRADEEIDDTGTYATDLLGFSVRKAFYIGKTKMKMFNGKITNITFDKKNTATYHVVYEDGDSEQLCYDDVKPLLVKSDTAFITEQCLASAEDAYSSIGVDDYSIAGALKDVIPTRREMLQQPDKDEFLAAEIVEMDNMQRHNVFTWADLPRGAKLVCSKFAYKRKRDQHGKIVKHKARLVACGYSQIYGENYFLSSAPVATATSFRLMMAIAVKLGFNLHAADCDGAFLNGHLDEEIFMSPPQGVVDPEGKGRVLRLHSSIYGLKQAAVTWHSLLIGEVRRLGYRAVDGSDCFWVRKDGDEVCMFVIHVDDLAIAYNSERLLKKLKDRLRSLWGLSSEGPLTFHLGMSIEHKVGEYVRVSQHAYIMSLAKRFEALLANEKSFESPASDALKISALNTGSPPDEESKTLLQEINGCLLYVAVMTRPDLAAICGQLGRVVHHANASHVKIAIRALKYLCSTPDLGLVYSRNDWSPPGFGRAIDSSVVIGYTDSDWGGDLDTRSSTSGFLTMLAGAPVDWKSTLQRIQALSSAEAEYVAMSAGAKSIVYVRNVLRARLACAGGADANACGFNRSDGDGRQGWHQGQDASHCHALSFHPHVD
jgi:hypothetical protein